MSEGKSNMLSKDSEKQNDKQLEDNIHVLLWLCCTNPKHKTCRIASLIGLLSFLQHIH